MFSPATFSDVRLDIGGRWYYTQLTTFATPTSPTNTTPQQFSIHYG